MRDYYILDGHTPVKATHEEWLKGLNNNRDVAKTTVNGVDVSTVFLGLDHSSSKDGPPLVFETMIFGGAHNENQWRCSTWEQALQQHIDAINLVTGSE